MSRELDDRVRKLGERIKRAKDPMRVWCSLCRKYPESADADFGEPGHITTKRMIYLAERLRGVEHVWAAMTAARKAPAGRGDRSLFEGVGLLGDQFRTEAQLRQVVAQARRHGYNPSQGDMYVPSLAAFAGDPAAFVPATGGRGHIQRVLEERNWSGHGVVNRTAREDREPAIPDGPHLADDLAAQIATSYAGNDRHALANLPDVVQEAKKKHGLSPERLHGRSSQPTHDVVPTFTSASLPAKKPRRAPPQIRKE